MKRGKRVGSTMPKRDAQAIFTRRAAMVTVGGAGVLTLIGVRLAQLQATDLLSQRYTEAADENRFDTRIITPPRGIIYDRFGTVLAQTSKDYQVSVIQEDAEDVEAVIKAVGEVLGLDEAWARRAYVRARERPRYEPAPLYQGLTWEEFNAINVRLPELRGIVADSTDVRAYPYDVVFAHPIGYVQKPTQRDIDAELAPERGAEGQRRAVYLRHPDVRVGKAGVEASMESVLHGQAGWKKVIVNAHGRDMGEDENERRAPVRGSGVVLTIDAELQRVAMENFGQDQAGAALVMDIENGDLLVMASAPGFDPNLFVNGIGTTDYHRLRDDEKKPLFHKTVAGAYAPGSTFKMVVGIAAKQAGVEDDWRVNCPGYFPYGGRNFHCWKRGGHGSVNLHDGIKHSCDVYFYQAALRAGPERIAAVARQFGFGTAFDVSTPNIEDGIVPDPEWMQRVRNQGWTGGLTLNYGIGQGDLLCTPLQLVTYAARMANNGHAVAPRLVREAPGVEQPGAAPQLTGIAAEHLARVRDGMYGVCNEPGGTATRAGNLGLRLRPDGAMVEEAEAERDWPVVQIAGKTGTAQVFSVAQDEEYDEESVALRKRDHALFIAFAPVEDPQIAIAVVVENGGHGGSVAAPIAREIMDRYLLGDRP